MQAQLTGSVLGRYELHERLGRGGMGDVYKAKDLTLDRWVAVKVLHGHLAEEANFRRRFEHEAKTMATLNHPNILQVYDYGYDEAQEAYCIVMEYLPSDTLEAHIERLRQQDLMVRLDAVRDVFGPLVQAIAYAHEQGMVHRDIKPSNIIFNDKGEAVLVDFGLARLITDGRLTLTGLAAGTPTYMSPEQGLGEGGDGRSDLYALGVILYEMVTGNPPFRAETPIGIVNKHVNEALPDLSEVVSDAPAGLQTVIERSMAKGPDDRYQRAADFFDDLLASLDGEPLMPSSEIMGQSRKTLTLATVSKTPTGIGPVLAQRPSVLFAALGAMVIILVVAIVSQIGMPGGAEALTQDSPPDSDGLTTLNEASEILDDFDDAGSGWPVNTEGPVQYFYDDGRYRFTNTLPGQARFAVLDMTQTYQSTFLQVDAMLEEGQAESGYGLVFRYQDSGNFYVFAVNNIGEVSMWAFEGGATWRELRGLPEQWTESSAVLTDGSPNALSVVADGDHLVGMVNHAIVIDVNDSTYDEGAVGFYVATTQTSVDDPLADVVFDNFLVQRSIPAMTQ